MFSVEVKNLDKVIATINRFPKVASGNVNEAIRKTLTTIQRKAMENAPVDTGKLRGDWELDYGNLTGSLRNRASYAIHQEFGTRPHFPPVDAVAPWANRHGIAPFLVARAISRKGTKGTKFFSRAIEGSKSEINTFFEKAIEKTMNEL